MSGAFTALMVFVASQCVLIGLGLIPQAKWRSFSAVSSAAARTGSAAV
jgi:hypothetical protein